MGVLSAISAQADPLHPPWPLQPDSLFPIPSRWQLEDSRAAVVAMLMVRPVCPYFRECHTSRGTYARCQIRTFYCRKGCSG
jgi:hypothetical protein